jgi:hypothetical protein
MLGIALLALSLLAVFCHTISIFAISGHAARVRADASYTAGRWRRWMMRMLGGPTSTWLAATVTSVLALVLVGGLASSYVANVGDLSVIGGTTSTPAPTWPPSAP